MICKSCSFDNKEGAAFCAKCGSPLTMSEPAADAAKADDDTKTVLLDSDGEKEDDDDSEASTTVLTSDMIAPKQGQPQGMPQGFVPNMNGTQTGGQGVQGAPRPMGPTGPQGTPRPMQGAPSGGATPQKPANNGGKSSKPAKTGTAAKVYIVVSVVLILAMAGAGVWLFLHFNSKIDDINKEKDSLASEMDASSSSYETQLSDKDSEIADLEASVSDYESQVADYESQISSYQETSESYSAYDSLIQFANSAAGQGYADFFASDTVLHLSGGEVAVMVYFGVQEESNVIYSVGDSSVASCEWGDSWEGDVATLYITPNGSGNTVITLSNDINDETIDIYVYVD